MIVINQLKTEIVFPKNGKKLSLKDMIDDIPVIKAKCTKLLKISNDEIDKISILKHSIDARKKPQIYQVYSIGINLKNKKQEEKVVNKCKNANILYQNQVEYIFPQCGNEKLDTAPVIIGMGPAGLFCAYMLAIHGYKPVVLERGTDVDTRTKDVENFWNGGQLVKNSNVQFGEGGAGTFSDGKLNTLIKDKSGRNKEVLKIFVDAGAPEEILYDAKPHIGTDILKKVVANMRNTIISNGGEVRFNSQVTAIDITDNKINSVTVNNTDVINTNQVVLAIGHSARDTFEYLNSIGIPMEAKSFAVGMRVEHPQSMINECMYGKEHGIQLPAAPYKLTAKTSTGRGVYSFCMCPGGYVVNASSEDNRLAVNGMSYSDRGSHNANSAIIITVTPEDFPGNGPLAGVEFQRKLEENAYNAGLGKVPVQYFDDYKENRSSSDLDKAIVEQRNQPCIKGEYNLTNLRSILPDECEAAFIEGMEHFDHIIKGFGSDEAILIGVESRTSSPVRIHRDDSLQCPEVRGLYPCGEGAGYAGGITSAAMDGILIAEKIAAKYKPF